jgi:release factor glutamine methyltransferase
VNYAKKNNINYEVLETSERKVINKSSELIKKSGHFIIEIGFDQKNKVKKILRDKGFYIKKTVKDLSNHDRCIVSIRI